MFSPGDQVVLSEKGQSTHLIDWWDRCIGRDRAATVVFCTAGECEVRRTHGGVYFLPPSFLRLAGPPTTVRQMSHKVYQAAM